MSNLRGQLGSEAEDLAVDFLERHGLRVVDRNARFKVGEIDIVARDGEVIVFVEVRSRTRPDVHPAATVTLPKRRHIVRAAEAYLQRHRLGHLMSRFDVVAVSLADGSVEHFPNAFEAGR